MFKHLKHKFISKDLVSAVKMLSYEYDYIHLMVMNSVTEKKLWIYFFKNDGMSFKQNQKQIQKLVNVHALSRCHSKTICPEEGLVLEMPAFPSFKGVQLALLSQLIKPKFLVCLSSLSICLSDCLSTCLFIRMFACCMSVFVSACSSVRLSVRLHLIMSICLSDCLTVFLSVCLPVCLPVCLSVCLFAYLPVYLRQRHLSLIMYDTVN